jgi:hypothetical protein
MLGIPEQGLLSLMALRFRDERYERSIALNAQRQCAQPIEL